VQTQAVNCAAKRTGIAGKSVIAEVREIVLAEELIRLGARLQLLEAETLLSRDRLIKLYKEIKGVSPPRGMLPSSPDWFLTWRPNIHSSLFHSIYRRVRPHMGDDDRTELHALVKSYRLYLETVQTHGEEPVLSLTRAWTLPRFFDEGVLRLATCTRCRGRFIGNACDAIVCGLCQPPSRAQSSR
jgi:flagellar transcriptional activator FlhC